MWADASEIRLAPALAPATSGAPTADPTSTGTDAPAFSTGADPGFIQRVATNPGASFLASALLPGSAQLAQRNPVRGALYLAVEAVALAVHADQIGKARNGEAAYERYADGNWSVVRYARWLVGYHDFHGLANPHIEQLRLQVTRLRPAYDTSIDWPAIPISLLRDVERNTLYIYGQIPGRNTFSHVMPDYGSQQYYELISKYYQYGPGWSDFPDGKFTLPWDGTEMTDQFYLGRDRAERFNDQYRTASNMVSVVILNHLFAAFDGYFTAKVRQSRVSLAAPVSMVQPLRMRMDF